MVSLAFPLWLMWFGAQLPLSDGDVSVSRVSIPITVQHHSERREASLPGELRVPLGGMKRYPAVLILHGSSGIDGRGQAYAEALNAAGIATLEIDMWAPRGLAGGPSGRPRDITETLPDAYRSLSFLASRKDIDPDKVGVMGFSWGGIMSLALASEALRQRYSDSHPRFVAHAPLYPVCWLSAPGGPLHDVVAGHWTGSPVFLQYGEADDYDRPDTCRRMRQSLPKANRALLTLKAYPRAEHGWDSRGAVRSAYDPSGNEGKGGLVRLEGDKAVAARSRAATVRFFKKAFQRPANR